MYLRYALLVPVAAVRKAPNPGVPRQRARAFVPGVSWEPLLVLDEDRRYRVRVFQFRSQVGQVSGLPLCVVATVYLDGTLSRESFTEARQITRERVAVMSSTDEMVAKVAAQAGVGFGEPEGRAEERTVDFARLESATMQLLALIDSVGVHGTDEDTELIWTSYQGMLRWREAAQRRMDTADAMIGMVAAKLRAQVLNP